MTANQNENDSEVSQSIILSFLPEVITSIKDNNRRTRKVAQELLNLFAETMKSLSKLNDFMQLIVGGLAGYFSLSIQFN